MFKGIEAIKSDLEFISNAENPVVDRTDRCNTVITELNNIITDVAPYGKYGEDGNFVPDETQKTEFENQIMKLTEDNEKLKKDYDDISKKYRSRFFGDNGTDNVDNTEIQKEEYVSAIDALFEIK